MSEIAASFVSDQPQSKSPLSGLTATMVLQKLWHRLALLKRPVQELRKLHLRLRGASIGKGTLIPRMQVTWPHQVRLGCNCVLQPDIFFNYSHYWTPGPSMIIGDGVFIGRGCEFNIREKIVVGDDCLIASNCTFVDANHGREPEQAMKAQPLTSAAITLGRNVWIGAQCVILKGVTIGDGAVVGAGSVVTRSIPAGETWGGVPARKITKSQN